MIELILQRLKRSKYGTFGMITDAGMSICKTLERLYLNNAPMVSCIKPGTYIVTVERSLKFPYLHYRLHDVDDRTDVLIHRGNTVIDTHGCILVGTISNEQGIEHSKDALDMLIAKYPNGFTLTIKD